MTVDPKTLARSVADAEKRKDGECESEAQLSEKLDLETELSKLTLDMVKDKSFKYADDQQAGILITTLENIQYGLEWKNEELKVVSRRNLEEKLVKKVEIYYDDLHQFLLAESEGYKEAHAQT